VIGGIVLATNQLNYGEYRIRQLGPGGGDPTSTHVRGRKKSKKKEKKCREGVNVVKGGDFPQLEITLQQASPNEPAIMNKDARRNVQWGSLQPKSKKEDHCVESVVGCFVAMGGGERRRGKVGEKVTIFFVKICGTAPRKKKPA